MDADLDLLLRTVFVTADDLLPERQNNAARRVRDAEAVTPRVAQPIMGIASDRRFSAVAAKRSVADRSHARGVCAGRHPAQDGTPRKTAPRAPLELRSPQRDEREIALVLLDRVRRRVAGHADRRRGLAAGS